MLRIFYVLKILIDQILKTWKFDQNLFEMIFSKKNVI